MMETPFAKALINGLNKRQKTLEPKFFYDAEGSRLFEEITQLDAYYPTRTELSILENKADEMAAFLGPGVVLVEPGAGAPTKAEKLLAAMKSPMAYAPGDISIDHLERAMSPLRLRFPQLRIAPFRLDFDDAFDLPNDVAALGPVAIFFPGSTIGNFSPEGARRLLRRFSRIDNAQTLLIGVDLKKDKTRLEHAYDDPEGVTAAFNLNLLARANRELATDFDLSSFRHFARYDEALGRVEMHLESVRDQTVNVLGKPIHFLEGESIHTENSYKFRVSDFQVMAAEVGWSPVKVWTDPDNLFAELAFSKLSL
jgi:L-histidine N-alpha-methyltransferase